ncbi:polycomb group RING finger protein 3 isoform X2 [Panthera tigris]|uniref:polycomb group RING finger protein 3 isoform X2 n=1 Tax=Panthera tigris TaxID=9694 RepID=UPI001C6F6BE2|nr:polycomb group RING finger protein 3 isoform X2 [Panthera tigris]
MLTRKIKLWDINAHITCRLCSGYLIDATTVTECLHTFCRSCLVKYLEENNTCPTCRIVIHQSHPLQYIGHDRTMQDIVYKLVPGLQEAEMRKQREFYHKLGMEVPGDIKGETCSAKQHLDPHRNGETKADDSSNKEAAEEKQEEDNDYHRSDEQDGRHQKDSHWQVLARMWKNGALVACWQEHNMVWPLGKTVWQFPKEFNIS